MQIENTSNEKAEASILGLMILNNNIIDTVRKIINPDSFCKTGHKHIFQVIVDLCDSDWPVDLITVRDELCKRFLLDEIGGVEYLMKLEERAPVGLGIQDIKYQANTIRH